MRAGSVNVRVILRDGIRNVRVGAREVAMPNGPCGIEGLTSVIARRAAKQRNNAEEGGGRQEPTEKTAPPP